MTESQKQQQLIEAICSFEGITADYFRERWSVHGYIEETTTPRLANLLLFLLNID